MAYIGRDTDKISNVEVLDNITFDGSSSYTLQKNSVNFTPSSANTLLLSIDGVVQAGNFTVSGSTIDFGTAVAGTSTCDFILHYGVGLITAPSDGTVTTAKLGDNAVTTAKLNDASVSLAKLTATGTKDATTFLRGDNTFASAGESNTPYFNATSTEVSDNFSDGALYTINNYNSVLVDTCSGFATGTGRYTPNVAGHYFFSFQCHVYTASMSDMMFVYGQLFKNGSAGSSYSQRCIQQIDFRNNYGNGATVNVQGIFEMNGSSDYVYSAVLGNTNSGADARFAGESNYMWFRGFLIART